jgi:UDP-N-acetylglucosamine 2-epimerase (non-hydrolysing)
VAPENWPEDQCPLSRPDLGSVDLMAGHRSSRPSGLRLVSVTHDGDRTTSDHRPLILYALGTARERLLLSPLVLELRHLDVFRQVVVAVGPEEDASLAGIPELAPADRRLTLDDHTPTGQLAALLAAFEHAIDEAEPELVVAAGAGDAGLAAALAAAKRGIAVAHVESGVRRPDPHPVEIQRVLNDRLADTLLAPTAIEADNLLGEGIPDTRVHVVGQTDVDVLRRLAPRARARRTWAGHGLDDYRYVLVEVSAARLAQDDGLLGELERLASRMPVALHVDGGLDPLAATHLRRAGIVCPLVQRRLDHVSLLVGAGAVLTDDGTVQDATSALGVSCFTLGDATDRPHTVSAGTNVLLGNGVEAIAGIGPSGAAPVANDLPPWDGHAARRAADLLVAHYVLAGARPAVARS